MPSFRIPPNSWNNEKYCDMERPDSTFVICDYGYKYRRIDGKCNNSRATSIGALLSIAIEDYYRPITPMALKYREKLPTDQNYRTPDS